MATPIKFLEFTIHLTNKAQVDGLQAQFPGGILVAPEAAAATYSAPIQFQANPGWDNPTPFSAPCIRSPYIINLSNHYPRNVAEFTRRVGGWFGIHVLFGTTYLYRWVGKFVYSASTTPEIGGAPTQVVAIAQRKFIIGWEGHQDAAGRSLGVDARSISRDASRHADMCGWSDRDDGSEVRANTDDHGVPLDNKTWERVYFRVRTVASSTRRFWRAKISTGSSAGVSLNMTPDRRIAIHNISAAGVETNQATSSDVFTLNQWYRLDILIEAKTPGGNIRVYVGRRQIMNVIVPDGVGLGTNGNHEFSLLGGGSGVPLTERLEMDFIDWVGAKWPLTDATGRFTGIDWLNGSKLQWVGASGFASGNNWAGDYRYLNQVQAEAADTNASMTSSTSGDALRAQADVERRADGSLGAVGAVCFQVEMFSRQQVAGNGTIGWKIGTGPIDLASINPVQSTTGSWNRRLHNPSGLTAPFDISPLELHHVKALNANAANVWCFGALVELVGIFGSEDIPVSSDEPVQPDTFPARRGIHNAPYPETPWARMALAPVSPVIVHSGTYVGNGTAQELYFRSNVNWLMIRRVASTNAAGSLNFSSMYGLGIAGLNDAEPNVQLRTDPSFVPGTLEDEQAERTVLRITGDQLNINSVGITYEFVAVQDPGARFHLNGAFHHDNDAGVSHVNPLMNSAFLPQYVFFHKQAINNGTYERFIKGPGHALNTGSVLNAAESATVAGPFVAGQITSLETIHGPADRSTAYSAWRTDDNSDDPNVAKVVKVGTYVGDGTASRTVSLAPPTGLRPLYVIVTPHNAASIHRDPAHTGTTSTAMGTGTENASTGITAGGIDSFSVGSALNANAIAYEYFVLLGSSTAGNNGFSIDGEFTYVEPDAPEGDFDDPDDASGGGVSPDPDPGPNDDDDCDEGDVCVAATTRLVNLALLKIGVQHFLTNYCTETVKEAQIARQVFEVAVRYTLRMFPWPFATKYQTLALAAVQPAANNEDWSFAYRTPVDCIYARRLVTPRNKALDPKGPPFMQSSDDTGGLIFSNQANAVLEYTARPVCVSFVADALFTEAFAWKLGAEMAPGLSRMTEVVTHCLAKFQEAIEKAESDIKLSVPGKVPAADPADLDTTAAQIAANVSVINRALLRIGARTIANYTTDQSREAIGARLVFEDELQGTLRDFPWAFATKYVAPVLVGGTPTLAVNVDWQYSFRAPTDCLMVRRLVTARGRSYERNPDRFRMAEDATGALVFCMIDDPTIEYTAREAGTVAKSDAKFRDAFAWRLAAALAPSLAQVDPEYPEQHGRGPEMPQQEGRRAARKDNKAAMRFQIARWAWAKYQEALSSATTTDANEKQEDKPGDADWILDRGIDPFESR